MARLTRMATVDRWSGSVIVATVAALAAMTATAAVSVLSSDEVTLAAPVYTRASTDHSVPLARARGGMRCVPAVADSRLNEPFPDACVVRRVSTQETMTLFTTEPLRRTLQIRALRPLHEVSEIPEDSI